MRKHCQQANKSILMLFGNTMLQAYNSGYDFVINKPLCENIHIVVNTCGQFGVFKSSVVDFRLRVCGKTKFDICKVNSKQLDLTDINVKLPRLITYKKTIILCISSFLTWPYLMLTCGEFRRKQHTQIDKSSSRRVIK